MPVPLQPSALRVCGVSARRAARTFLSLAIIVSVGAFAAAQRRNFPATYTITHVQRAESGVELTLTLTVRNYSGRDIEGCGIVLDESGPLAAPIGDFAPIDLLPSYGEVTVRHKFTVSKSEYSRWQQGGNPSLEILLPDGHSGTRIEAIDARRETPLADPAE
ncbi:MAG: hypothetical protein WBE76_13585 [Terracidiphilus sp.]